MTFGEQFLRSPDLFPARLAGEPWGGATVDLDLAGDRYRISGLEPEQRDSMGERYDVSAPSNISAVSVHVYRAPESDFHPIDTRGWEYALDIDSTGEAVALCGMRVMARIDANGDRAAIWTPVSDRKAFWGVLENVLRPLVAMRLLDAGGLLVHSAAVVIDGNGFLFAGTSGAGKSTIAGLALAAGYPVLSDDLNAVVRDGDRFALMPLPFTGDLTRAETTTAMTTLRALIKLEKGAADALRPLASAAAVALLVGSAPYVNRMEVRTERLLERAGEIARRTAPAALTFRRDGDIWPILAGIPW